MAQTQNQKQDMTQGRILPHLVGYSVPLILGNCFQLGYNAVDSIIAGRFIGRDALAAEGAASPVMNLIILAITGLVMGAGVLISEFYGAKKYDRLKRTMSTAVLFGLFFSVAVALLGLVFARPLLLALSVPADILDMTAVYLRITFLGAPFTYFYNALAASLKGIGDSKTPLKFLVFSSVLNAVLDLFFLGVLGFGIRCSAVTTVAAEAASAVLAFLYIYRKVPLLSLRLPEWRIDRRLLAQILHYGTATALQQAVQPIGKILIQGQVNALGVDVMAAFNACTRVDDFAFTPEQSIGHGITTFIAQNRGAGKKGRIRAGFFRGVLLEFCYWILIGLTAAVFGRTIVGWFVSGSGGAAVIDLGGEYLHCMALFYLWAAMTNALQGFFRGMGCMWITLLGTFIQTSLRVTFTYLLAPSLGLPGIAIACCTGWSAMLLVEIPLYVRFSKKIT